MLFMADKVFVLRLLSLLSKMIWILADNFESLCGKYITLTKKDTTGVILLGYKAVPTEEKSSTCAFSLSTGDENLIISIALKVNSRNYSKASGLNKCEAIFDSF